MCVGRPIGSKRVYVGAAIGGRTRLPDPDNLPADIEFGHTRFAEAQASKHNWALHGTITEEQGEIHVAQGKVIGGGSSINGQAMQRGFPWISTPGRLSATMNGRTRRSCRFFENLSVISTFRVITAMARTDRCPSGAASRIPGLPSSRRFMRPVCKPGLLPRRTRMGSVWLAWG
jgi:hypothetical protein